MDSLGSLTGYARGAAQRILASFPEWRPFARAEPAPGTPAVLVIEVPPPAPGGPRLALYADDEITVYVDQWHGHFERWADDPDDDAPANACHAVRELLAERTAVAVGYHEGRWGASWVLAPGEVPRVPPGYERVAVRSWRGTRDAEYRAD